MKKIQISKNEIRDLVIARLRSLSPKRKISIGGEGEFTKQELIDKVRKNDPIRRKIVKIQLSYLQSFKKGLIS